LKKVLADSARSGALDRTKTATKASSAIQKAALENAWAAVACARLFIELPGVFSGPRFSSDPNGLPWLPRTLFLSQFLWVKLSILQGSILAHHRCRTAKTRADATMKIRGCFPMARQTSHVIVQPTAPGPQKPARPRDPVASGERDAAHNRAASHNYFLLEKFEAGVSLRGTEVKSIREGKANLKDSYGLIQNGEAFLLNLHIGPYSHGNISNHDATRTRKLLLHRAEVRKLLSKTQIKGHTLIPTRLYFRNGRVKCELAVAKGKQDWDKRETERSREADREARSAINASKHRGGR
jgi:SsrA-binding protein